MRPSEKIKIYKQIIEYIFKESEKKRYYKYSDIWFGRKKRGY